MDALVDDKCDKKEPVFAPTGKAGGLMDDTDIKSEQLVTPDENMDAPQDDEDDKDDPVLTAKEKKRLYNKKRYAHNVATIPGFKKSESKRTGVSIHA